MTIIYNTALTPRAQELRKNMTHEEKHLWYDFLRNYPVKFRRQKIISSFIADFYCREALLVIEVDGSQHYDEQGMAYDAERTKIIEAQNIIVIRFTNHEVNTEFNSCCALIHQVVTDRVASLKSARQA